MVDREILWRGFDEEGIECQIARQQWGSHVAKRPEIEDTLALTRETMLRPDRVEPDKNRSPDEEGRYFKILSRTGTGRWGGYRLKVSAKYVKQEDDKWIKFYQSCWYEREKR